MALLLTEPEKVQHSDDSKVKIIHKASFTAEIRALGKALSRRNAGSKYLNFQDFVSNCEHRSSCCYLSFARHSSINKVGVCSYLETSCPTEYFTDCVLDFEAYYFGIRARALIGFIGNFEVAWVYGWVIQEKLTRENSTLNWADKKFTEGLFVILLWSKCRTRYSG